MNVGIIGLGLIGGSMAKAFRAYTRCRIYGGDADDAVVDAALADNVLDRRLTKDNIPKCDLIISALYPKACVDFIKENAPLISKDCIVMDCGGVKGYVCDELRPVAREYGFTFIGAHPMAGLHMSGYAYSDENMFRKASLVLCPDEDVPQEKLWLVKGLFPELGFTNLQIATPQEHDAIIAFTSQLCHIVSNAYVKNSAARLHCGFSAGSYRDLTRVAKLNENMWTELFLENRENLLKQLDELIDNLIKYREALSESDAGRLRELLKEGREIKERIDGNVYRD